MPKVNHEVKPNVREENHKVVIVSASTAKEAKRAVHYLSRDLTYETVEYVIIVGPPLLEDLTQLHDFLIFDYINTLPGSKEDVNIYPFHPHSSNSWKKCAKSVFTQAYLKDVYNTLISQDNGLITAFTLSVVGLLTQFNEVSVVKNGILLSDPLFPAPIMCERLPQSNKKRKIVQFADTGVLIQKLIDEIGEIAYDYTNSLAERGVIEKGNSNNGVRVNLLPKGKIWSAFLEVKEKKRKGADHY